MRISRQIGWSRKSNLLYEILRKFDRLSAIMSNVTLVTGKLWYVRPLGGSYGSEDGTSYANAWDGFADINTAVIHSGDTVLIDGTHNEFFPASKVVNGVTYKSYNTGSPAILDGQDTRNICMDVTGKSNVSVQYINFVNALVTCLHLDGTTGFTSLNILVDGSGNQGIQHLGASTATHTNLTASNCADDGVSVHDTGIVYINGTSLFDGNLQNINNVGSSQVYLSGNFTFQGTSTYDLYATNADTEGSCFITVTGPGTVRNINSDIGAVINLTDVTVSGTTAISGSVGTGSVVLVRSILTGALTLSAQGTLTATDSRITSIAVSSGAYILDKCVVRDEINMTSTGSILAYRTFFDGTGTTAALVDVNSGASAGIRNCIFKGMATNIFGLSYRTGAIITFEPSGNVFIGAANVGRGLFSQIDITSNNNIYYDLAIGTFRSAGTFVVNNSCYFDCTTPKSGTTTSNNEVTGDPLFIDVSTNDYNLGIGSSCLDTGLTLGAGFEVAIDTAVWGDASTVPVVVTADQSGTWNIGAYV
jgi:hypothetical protein